jgi:transposase
MPKFKTYQQNQSYLLPPSLSDCLPKDHICFAINNVVDGLDLNPIEKTYSNQGASAYSPSALVKVLFLAYIQGIRSSRKIETKLYQDIAFRFLSGNITPDHGTINLFRKNHLENLKEVFAQIIVIADGVGMVDLADISIDGTKIKANASMDNTLNLKQLGDCKKYFEKVMEEAEEIDKQEDKKYGASRGYGTMPKHLIDPKARQIAIETAKKKLAKLKEAENKINEKQELAKNKEDKKLKKNNTQNLTDPDANLMKMKDGSFKAGYNVQLATSRQFIAAYGLNDDSADSRSLPGMVCETETNTKIKVETVKADAGYFSKSNIEFLENNKINDYIPPLKNSGGNSDFKYDKAKDEFICSQGKRLTFKRMDRGAKQYWGAECSGCPKLSECTKMKCKSLNFDFELVQMSETMDQKLKTESGRAKYKERITEIEPVFGNIKHNQGFTAFLCRGKTTALAELGLVCIAHNLVKIFRYLQAKPAMAGITN